MDLLAPLAPGTRLGPYVLGAKIGEGGMGVVYEATHSEHHRRAAVKVLAPWLATEVGRARFEREVQACATLGDPHTIEIYDFGETADGTLYYAMELLDGLDLRRLVEVDGPQPPARVIRVLAQIAGALGEAHDKGLVHRDIKPPNIVLCAPREGAAPREPDTAMLLDFGLVMPLATSARITAEGAVLGTPRYVAPEMLDPEASVSPRADLYALGLVAYFLLSGRHTFEGAANAEILRKQKEVAPTPLAEVAPSVPDDLAALVHRCLEKDPARRPASASELQGALLACKDASAFDDGAARAWWARLAASDPGADAEGRTVGDGSTSPDGPRAKRASTP